MEKVSKYGDGSNNKELIITDKFGNVKSIFQKKISLTTLGTSGPSTFINNILNVPDYSGSLTGYVPYIGATQNVNLGEYSLQTSQLQFDLTPTGTPCIGIMRWNDQDGTVDLGLKGGNVTLQIGQEQVTRVVNKTGINLLEANYQAVRISGAQGNRLKVALAQANNDANSAETLGIVTETINDNQEGFITTSGLVRNINTTGSLQGETWSDGDMLYLSGTIAGQLTNIKPTAPVHTIIMGYVVRAHATQGQIYVKVDNGYELDELHNVAITSPLNNQGLFYETATQLWKNKSIDTALGYTPVPTTRTLTINGTTYDLTANRTWSVGTVTGVTASAPLSSSGGITPNITISQATGSTNGYLSSTDWTTFNSKQPAGNYITALSGEASGSGPGTASVTLNNASVTAKVLTGVNITGGSISASDSILTAFGKLQNQINGLIGSSVYQGTWNASTNTPALASGVGTRGYYYIVNVAGSTNLDGITDWNVGDWAIFDGTAWQQVDNTDSVTSVNGLTGAVSLTTDNIPEGVVNQYFTSLRARQSISLTTTGSSGAATYDNGTGVLNIPNYSSALSGYVPITRELTINGTTYDLSANRTWNVGTVTSVDMSVPTGFVISGNPITSSGTLALSFNSDYSLPTIASQLEWDTAYDNMIVSASVTGTTTKTLTLNQQDGGTITTSWTDYDTAPVTSVFGRTGAVVAQSGDYSTTLVTEGTNLYFTDSRARSAISLTTIGSSGAATYNSITGILNIPNYSTALSGYVPTSRRLEINGVSYDLSADRSWSVGTVTSIATTGPITGGTITGSGTIGITQATTSTDGYLSSTDWNTFNNKQGAITLTTTGTSGAATLIGNTLNIPQYQSVITNPVTGTGTTNYVARWISSSQISTGVLYDNGTNVGIGTTAPIDKLHIATSNEYQISWERTGISKRWAIGGDVNGTYITNRTDSILPIFIANSGNIGIGALGPNSLLSATERVLLIENSNLASLYLSSLAGRKWSMSSAGDGALVWWDLNSVSERMRINSSGNVGIGTSSPAYKLTVAGRTYVDQLQYNQAIQISGTDLNGWTDAGFYAGSGLGNAPDPYGWYFITVERHSDASWAHQTATSYGAGNTGNRIYSRTKEAGGWTAWKELSYTSNISGTTNYVSKFTSSSTIGNSLIYDNGTNVGIGTASPGAYKLDVAGDIHVQTSSTVGTVYFGNNGQNYLSYYNTDSYYRANGNHYFEGNGFYKGVWDSNANLGIGNTNPTQLVDIGPTAAFKALRVRGTYNFDGSYLASAGVNGGAKLELVAHSDTFTSASYRIQHNRDVTTALTFDFASPASSYAGLSYVERMRIDANGNVGIGSSSFNLTASGRTNVSISGSSSSILEFQSSGSNTAYIYAAPGAFEIYGYDNMILSTNGSERLRITNTGNVGIGTSSPLHKLSVLGGSNTYIQVNNGSSSTYLGQLSGNGVLQSDLDLTILSGGSEKMRITTSGNVGIGTSSPTYKLQVLGTAYINETLYVNGFTTVEDSLRVTGAYYDSNNQAGTSGQILSSTGLGTDWVDSPTATATSVAQLLPSATVTYSWVGQVIDGTWVNIFTRANNVLTTGTWIVRAYVYDAGQGGQHYDYAYSGTMTWYQSGTNQSGILAASEIALHRMGHAANSCVIYLRTTEESASDGGNGKLQIKGNYTNTSNTTITFTFVKII